MAVDARKAALYRGLAQLDEDELQRILDYRRDGGVMVYDNFNFEEATGHW